jgi:broad specificity phosphatase PhoE
LSNSYFITHPDVVIDPAIPVPRWPLSPVGMARMRRTLEQPWASELSRVFSSDEQKAQDGAQLLASALDIAHESDPELGENDRSATGYLAPEEFWPVVERFFGEPESSVRGWERAVDAQSRVVRAVRRAALACSPRETIAFVAHGAVGALLLCHLRDSPILRSAEQPGGGGGHYLSFNREAWTLDASWQRIDP